MRKSARRDDGKHPASSPAKSARRKDGTGAWEFTSSGRLFAMGSTDAARRAAYRAADGQMRFLPL